MSTLLSNAKGGAYSGHLMGLFTAIAFGSAYPIGKPIVAVVDPFVFSAARYLAAGGVLLLGLILFSRTGARVPWRDVPRLAVTGFLGFAVFQGLWGIALDLTTASKASVLVSTSPIFAAIIYAIQGHKLSVSAWLGVVVAFLGVFCVINNSLTDFTLGERVVHRELRLGGAFGGLGRIPGSDHVVAARDTRRAGAGLGRRAARLGAELRPCGPDYWVLGHAYLERRVAAVGAAPHDRMALSDTGISGYPSHIDAGGMAERAANNRSGARFDRCWLNATLIFLQVLVHDHETIHRTANDR